jgi:predicted 3-demethylubiquinone-9 3-methyltransferase (glyoxalase superfamily)
MATKHVTPFIWLEGGATEARDFYLSLFPEATVDSETPGFRPDEPMGVAMTIAGTSIILFNGGPGQPHTWAFSLMVSADTQEEADRLWEGLVEGGGEHSKCGWLQDRFGVWWQIIPDGFMDVIAGPDEEGRERAREAMLKMDKLVLADLQAAYAGTS